MEGSTMSCDSSDVDWTRVDSKSIRPEHLARAVRDLAGRVHSSDFAVGEDLLRAIIDRLQDYQLRQRARQVACAEKGVQRVTLDVMKMEVKSARKKFPNPDSNFAALVEEVGEVARACLQHGSRSWQARREMVQVGAMAIRLYEEGDPSFERLSPDQRKP